MPIIQLSSKIKAPISRVFDLARSIDLHTRSTSQTNEKAIDGKMSGLIGFGETVTWEATHFWVKQRLTSKIVEFDKPNHFRDSMISGAFASFDHDHFFEESENGTLMKDVFDYASPFWFFGKIADGVFLENYMKKLLIRRNEIIKQVAESDQWKQFV